MRRSLLLAGPVGCHQQTSRIWWTWPVVIAKAGVLGCCPAACRCWWRQRASWRDEWTDPAEADADDPEDDPDTGVEAAADPGAEAVAVVAVLSSMTRGGGVTLFERFASFPHSVSWRLRPSSCSKPGGGWFVLWRRSAAPLRRSSGLRSGRPRWVWPHQRCSFASGALAEVGSVAWHGGQVARPRLPPRPLPPRPVLGALGPATSKSND